MKNEKKKITQWSLFKANRENTYTLAAFVEAQKQQRIDVKNKMDDLHEKVKEIVLKLKKTSFYFLYLSFILVPVIYSMLFIVLYFMCA